MLKTKIAGIGMYVPPNVVTNNDLTRVMDTSDEWIQERTGIKERRFATRYEDTTATMGAEAAKIAIQRAGITAQDVDFIIFATLSPDYFFPGCGVLVQRMLGMKEIGALDIRNQCSGFLYGVSVADQFIKTGMYKNILLIGSETHSYALDFSTKGRNVSVIFGDGAGAVILQPTNEDNRGILSTHLHSDGNDGEMLSMPNPGFHAGKFWPDKKPKQPEGPYGNMFITQELVDKEAAEIAVIEEYLPQAASEAEIEQAVTAAVAETGATSMKEMGAVMKAAMAKLAGKNADGKLISETVKKKLAG